MKTFVELIQESLDEATGKKFKGTYNWNKEVHTLYTHAPSDKSAHMNFCSQLAKKLNRNTGSVVNYFKSNQYKVEEV